MISTGTLSWLCIKIFWSKNLHYFDEDYLRLGLMNHSPAHLHPPGVVKDSLGSLSCPVISDHLGLGMALVVHLLKSEIWFSYVSAKTEISPSRGLCWIPLAWSSSPIQTNTCSLAGSFHCLLALLLSGTLGRLRKTLNTWPHSLPQQSCLGENMTWWEGILW